MLERIHYLAKKRIDFAFETTLASRTFAPWIADLRKTGYDFCLVFLWLPNEDFAVARVAETVRMGGHNVPDETIRRRYHAGIRNFFKLYRPLADTWFFYDNSAEEPRAIAYYDQKRGLVVNNSVVWHNIVKGDAVAEWRRLYQAAQRPAQRIFDCYVGPLTDRGRYQPRHAAQVSVPDHRPLNHRDRQPAVYQERIASRSSSGFL